MSSTTPAVRRAFAATLAAAIATGALTLAAAPAARADLGPSCTFTISPGSIRPGDSATIAVQTSEDSYFPAIQLENGHVVPGATMWWATATVSRDYSWLQSFGDGRGASTGYRLFEPGTDMNAVTDATPSLCGGEVNLLPAAEAQTIEFPSISSTPLSAGTVPLAALATSGLPVTYVSTTPDVCTVAAPGVEVSPGHAVDGSSVTLLARGYCSITASQGGDESFAPASDASASFYVQGPQTLTFPPIPDTLLSAGAVQLGASADSGDWIRYTVETPAVCEAPMEPSARSGHAAPHMRAAGDVVTLKTVGTCTVTAQQPAYEGGEWLASNIVTRSFRVYEEAAAPTAVVSLAVPAGVALSDGTARVRATSTVSVPAVTLTSTTPSVCTVASATSVTLAKAGTCTLAAAQPGAATLTRSFPVWGAPAIPTKGKATQTLDVLGHGESLGVSARPAEVCRVVNGQVLLVAPGTCRVKLTRGTSVVRHGAISVAFPKSSKPAQQLTHGGTAYFAFDSAVLTGKAKRALRGHLATLESASVVVVYGNTYGPGKNSAHSRRLADQRAAAVVAFLKAHGVTAKAVTVAAAMENPVSADPAKNRRADIYYRA